MRFHAATHKGLFTIEKQGGRWDISRVDFLGDSVSMLLPDRRDGSLYAVLTLGHFGTKLRRTQDDGANWEELTAPVFPEGSLVAPNPFAGPDAGDEPASLKEIWSLEAGAKNQPGRLYAGTIPGALFVSDDGGQTWELNAGLWELPERRKWFGGGKDESGVHSICVDPRDPSWITVAISCGGVWQTRDGGASWICRADGMRAEYMPPDQAHDPVIQDPHRMVQSPTAPDEFWVQHHNGIFHSTDGCENWSELPAKPSGFGFAVAVHPEDSRTAWFIPGVKDECRVPVDGALSVTRTRDGGVTFESLREGLPQRHCYDVVYRHALAVADDGRTLAFGSTCGNVWVSEDGGDSWQSVASTLPMVYTVRFA